MCRKNERSLKGSVRKVLTLIVSGAMFKRLLEQTTYAESADLA